MEYVLECSAEVGGAAETPGIGDLRDRLASRCRIAEFFTAAAQPHAPDIFGRAGSLALENLVDVPLGTVHYHGDLVEGQPGIPQVLVNVGLEALAPLLAHGKVRLFFGDLQHRQPDELRN